jgi:hypothetical protein
LLPGEGNDMPRDHSGTCKSNRRHEQEGGDPWDVRGTKECQTRIASKSAGAGKIDGMLDKASTSEHRNRKAM